jgi:formyl-CoA transferase
VQRYDEVTADPHLTARDYFVDAPHTTLGKLRVLGSAMRFDEVRPEIRTAAPLLGEHTTEVLRRAGLSEVEVSHLVDSGVAVAGKGDE